MRLFFENGLNLFILWSLHGIWAEMVRQAVGYDGDVIWDRSKPDGTPQRLLDVSLLHRMGWQAQIPLEEGIADTYAQYRRRTIRMDLNPDIQDV